MGSWDPSPMSVSLGAPTRLHVSPEEGPEYQEDPLKKLQGEGNGSLGWGCLEHCLPTVWPRD